MKRSTALVAAAVTGAMFHAHAARAQASANDRAVAEALFRDARQLSTSERWAEACPKFAESQRLDPKLGTLLYLATCHEREGKLASAWVEFTEARAQAARANQNDRERIAKERATAIEPRLSRIVVEAEAPTAGLTLELDGKALSSAVLGSPIPVDPGDHTIGASAPDREPTTLKVSIVGEGQLLKVRVPALRSREVAPPPPPKPPPVLPPPPAPEVDTTQRDLGIVIAGVGGALLVAGGIFGFSALAKESDAKSDCVDLACSQDGLDKHEAAQTLAHFSTAGLALGAIGVGVGGYLFFTAPKGAPVAALRVTPIATPGSLGASLGAAF